MKLVRTKKDIMAMPDDEFKDYLILVRNNRDKPSVRKIVRWMAVEFLPRVIEIWDDREFVKRYMKETGQSTEERRPKIIIEDTIDDVTKEDGGHAKIATISDDIHTGVFFRFQSWSEPEDEIGSKQEIDHSSFDSFIGKKVRITLEVIDG